MLPVRPYLATHGHSRPAGPLIKPYNDDRFINPDDVRAPKFRLGRGKRRNRSRESDAELALAMSCSCCMPMLRSARRISACVTRISRMSVGGSVKNASTSLCAVEMSMRSPLTHPVELTPHERGISASSVNERSMGFKSSTSVSKSRTVLIVKI